MPNQLDTHDLLSVTALIVSSFVNKNTVRATELPELVTSVHTSLVQAMDRAPAEKAVATPAVPIKKSIQHDYIVCLEDGKKLKMLKRYLHKSFGLTPDEYRAKWGLPVDYPMVAPGYSIRRAELAKASAFGNYRKRAAASSLVDDSVSRGPAKRRGAAFEKAA